MASDRGLGVPVEFEAEELGLVVASGRPQPLLLRSRRPSGVLPDVGGPGWLCPLVDQHAAVLVRGLGLRSDEEVDAALRALMGDRERVLTGEHPTLDLSGLYETVRYSSDDRLLWHHENSFAREWPRYIAFAVRRAADRGGETTLVDTRLVTSAAPPALVARLSCHGVTYERLVDGRGGRSWQELYGTEDADTARRNARAADEVLDLDGGNAMVRTTRPAFLPDGSGRSWFNQILHWHPHALPERLRALVASGAVPAPRRVWVGDGGEISDADVAALVEEHRARELRIALEDSDVLVIDNRVVAHGRLPYAGSRRILACFLGLESHPSESSR